MYLIQILLPLADNAGEPFPAATLEGIREELAGTFGGLTAFSRAPAEGVWANAGHHEKDDIVIVEVMADALDRAWWGAFRSRVERKLGQERLIIRAQAIEML